MSELSAPPKVLIGLGNPDVKFTHTRHNAGFKVIDTVAAQYGGHWRSFSDKQIAQIRIHDIPVLLVKPLTYMNNSGDVVPYLKKNGFTAADILVIHDELESAQGKLSFKGGGSARGHNGIKSLIERWGTQDFRRLRVGIGRPEDREQVSHYVLQRFENLADLELVIQQAVTMIEDLYT